MKVSKRGRTYQRGNSISIDLRRSIIDEIVVAGYHTSLQGHFKLACFFFLIFRNRSNQVRFAK